MRWELDLTVCAIFRSHTPTRFTSSRAREAKNRLLCEQDEELQSLDALLLLRNDSFSRPLQARNTQHDDDSNGVVQVMPRLEPDSLDEPEDEGYTEKDKPRDMNSETSGEIFFASDVLCSPRGAVGRAEAGIFGLEVLENGIVGHHVKPSGGDPCVPGDTVVKFPVKESRQRSSDDETHRGDDEKIRESQNDDGYRTAETDHGGLGLEHRRSPDLRDETVVTDEDYPGGNERTALSDEARGSLRSQLEPPEEASRGHAARQRPSTDGAKKEGSEISFSPVHGKRASAQSTRGTYIRERPRVEVHRDRKALWEDLRECPSTQSTKSANASPFDA